MTNSSNRRPKSSNKSNKPQDQVVDVTPLNSVEQSKNSSKIESTSKKNSSSNKKTSFLSSLSNGSGGVGSTKIPIRKNKGFEANENFGIALGMIETRGLVPAIEAADAMTKAAEVNLIVKELVVSLDLIHLLFESNALLCSTLVPNVIYVLLNTA